MYDSDHKFAATFWKNISTETRNIYIVGIGNGSCKCHLYEPKIINIREEVNTIKSTPSASEKRKHIRDDLNFVDINKRFSCIVVCGVSCDLRFSRRPR